MVAEHRSTRILTAAACAAIVGLAPVAIHAQKEPPSSPYEGRLAKAVYLSADVAQALEALVASAPAADKPVLTAATERAKQPFAADGKGDAPSAKGSLENRAALIRGMVAVVATPEARAESAAASQALLASSGPPVEDIQGITAALGRAEAAEAYLKANRESALTPYVYGYLMVQYRIAFERQASAKALEGQKATAKKYRAFLLRGRASQDPLVKALVTDIDAPYFLERPTAEHPRDFDPDACCRNR